jgi:hypothetical protein
MLPSSLTWRVETPRTSLEVPRRKMKMTMVKKKCSSVLRRERYLCSGVVVVVVVVAVAVVIFVIVVVCAFRSVSTSHALAMRRHGAQVEFGHTGYNHLLQSECG